ncbi:hypothetical protein [uncultured Sphingomonas sp.]|uniref:hypothetical protein n=1 Tax=uncultured Sphingomonas sp. TaxID=158754 RepID=UPI0026105DFA|nr:hypothetical protein [uncultured Sphingomonas sp.]
MRVAHAAYGRFQLLGLQDFPGRGTELVGVVAPLWDDKGYVTGPEYRRFCDAVVPLARMPQRVVHSGETFAFTIDVANFSDRPIAEAGIAWWIVDAKGKKLADGSFPARIIVLGNTPMALEAAAALRADTATAAKLTVAVSRDDDPISGELWRRSARWGSGPARRVAGRVALRQPGGSHEGHVGAGPGSHSQGRQVCFGTSSVRASRGDRRPVLLGGGQHFFGSCARHGAAPPPWRGDDPYLP